MPKSLPPRPNLEQLKTQAKDLLKLLRAGEPDAIKRAQEFHPRYLHASTGETLAEKFTLSAAQLIVAREYGFINWPKLKAHVESLASKIDPAMDLIAAIKANDASQVADVIERYPELKQRINDSVPNYAFGATALIGAVQRANREMVERINTRAVYGA